MDLVEGSGVSKGVVLQGHCMDALTAVPSSAQTHGSEQQYGSLMPDPTGERLSRSVYPHTMEKFISLSKAQ